MVLARGAWDQPFSVSSAVGLRLGGSGLVTSLLLLSLFEPAASSLGLEPNMHLTCVAFDIKYAHMIRTYIVLDIHIYYGVHQLPPLYGWGASTEYKRIVHNRR